MKNILLLLFLFFSNSTFSQIIPFEKHTSVGINVPVLLDNVLELGLRHQFHKNMRLDFSFGGSPDTRGKFANGKGDNNPSIFIGSEQNTRYYYQSEKNSGAYAKLGLSFIFNVSDHLFSSEDGNFKFYVGPIIAFSKFNEDGLIIKTVYPKPNSDGTSPQQNIVTKSTFNEKGTKFGSGFTMGVTIADKKNISCDFGVDFIGFKRKSQLNQDSHTIGFGNNLVVRLNYNFPKKR